MATPNTEIPLDEDDLDALMMELEQETANLVAAPTVTAPAPKPAAVPGAPKEETEAEGLARIKAEAAAKRAAKEGTAAPMPEIDEMAELEAELETASTPAVVEKITAAIAEATPAPKLPPAVAAKIAALADDAPFEPTEKTKAAMDEARTLTKDDADTALEDEMAALEAELSGSAALEADNPTHPLEVELAQPTPEPAPAAIEPFNSDSENEPAPAPEPKPAPRPEPDLHNPPKKPTLEFHIDVDQFRSDIKVSETNLDNCFMEQAGLTAHYVKMHALSEAQAARVKLQVEIAEARLYDKHRKALAAAGEKVTEKMIDNAVKMDPAYAAINVRLIEAESVAAINKGLVEGLKARKDMLVQLGSDRRADGAGAARILAAQANNSNMADRARAVGNQARGGE